MGQENLCATTNLIVTLCCCFFSLQTLNWRISLTMSPPPPPKSHPRFSPGSLQPPRPQRSPNPSQVKESSPTPLLRPVGYLQRERALLPEISRVTASSIFTSLNKSVNSSHAHFWLIRAFKPFGTSRFWCRENMRIFSRSNIDLFWICNTY